MVCAERELLARRHAEWVATLLEWASDASLLLPTSHWLPLVDREMDNARTAVKWQSIRPARRGSVQKTSRVKESAPSLTSCLRVESHYHPCHFYKLKLNTVPHPLSPPWNVVP
jgi:hypothetical protein